MAVGYSVVPLDNQIRDHLRDVGLETWPGEDGRRATPAELRAAIARSGLTLETHGTWDARSASWSGTISSAGRDDAPWAEVVLSGVRGDTEPVDLGFDRGWSDLIVRLLVALAEISGPLVLFDDAGSPPLLITSRTSPEEALLQWK